MPIHASITPDDAVALLNSARVADPLAIAQLVDHRVQAGPALMEHPTVQCGHLPDQDPLHRVGFGTVGLVGIINGLFGTDDQGQGPITADYDDAGALVGFRRTR